MLNVPPVSFVFRLGSHQRTTAYLTLLPTSHWPSTIGKMFDFWVFLLISVFWWPLATIGGPPTTVKVYPRRPATTAHRTCKDVWFVLYWYVVFRWPPATTEGPSLKSTREKSRYHCHKIGMFFFCFFCWIILWNCDILYAYYDDLYNCLKLIVWRW